MPKGSSHVEVFSQWPPSALNDSTAGEGAVTEDRPYKTGCYWYCLSLPANPENDNFG